MQRKSYVGIDLTGFQKGRLTVLKKAETGRTTWVCKCSCGNVVLVHANVLLNSKTISCGCAERENSSHFGDKTRTHGESKTRLYKTYRGMIDRCYNPNLKIYAGYGARGIRVCDEWKNSYTAFRDWAISAGYVEGLGRTLQSIDRIDVNGDYCPENCRWATAKVQQKNKRNTTLYFFNGKMITASEFADENGITDKSFVYRKAKRGIPLEKILDEWNCKHDMPKSLISVSEYATLNNISPFTVKHKLTKGEIDGRKICNKWYVIRKE